MFEKGRYTGTRDGMAPWCHKRAWVAGIAPTAGSRTLRLKMARTGVGTVLATAKPAMASCSTRITMNDASSACVTINTLRIDTPYLLEE